MEDQIGINQEQMIIAEGFCPADHQIFEASHFPDQVGIPEVSGVVTDIRIMEAGGLEEDLTAARGELTEQLTCGFILIVIDKIEIQCHSVTPQAQQ
ncbi:hypothetical protein D3C75_1147310 [compost metagenome]